MQRVVCIAMLALLAACGSPRGRDTVVFAPPVSPAGPIRVSATQPVDWSPMQRVLAAHVTDAGRVDYVAVAHREPMQSLADVYTRIARLGPRSQPDQFPTRADKLAYCLNAHNLFVLLAIAPEFGPRRVDPKSVASLPASLETGYVFVLDGHSVTLRDIRRHVRELAGGDPRPMLGLCGGRANDPPLRREVYAPDTLDAQLEDQLVRVLSGRPWCEIDHAARRIELPAAIVECEPFFRARYRAQQPVSARQREAVTFATLLLAQADAQGRAWLNRAMGYRVAPARPSDAFNRQPLFSPLH